MPEYRNPVTGPFEIAGTCVNRTGCGMWRQLCREKALPLSVGMLLTLGLWAGAATHASAQSPSAENKCERLNNMGSFACSGRVVSWIEVRVEGDLMKPHREKLRTLIRQRLQEELSYLGHEDQKFTDAARRMRNQPIAEISRFRAERGEVDCYIWTVGTSYPIPLFVQCELTGWGVGLKMTNEFSARFLGAGPPEDIPPLAESGIDNAIRQIADRLLAVRQEWRQLAR